MRYGDVVTLKNTNIKVRIIGELDDAYVVKVIGFGVETFLVDKEDVDDAGPME